MEAKKLAKLQVGLGVVSLLAVLLLGIYVIRAVAVDGLMLAQKDMTKAWADTAKKLNLSADNSDIQGHVTGFVNEYGLISQTAIGIVLLLVLNGSILSVMMILQGMKGLHKAG